MKKRILIVDDNSVNLYMMETLLKGYGYDVIMAENGKQALEKARLDLPDLVISDILMPVMDGYNLCREWKSDETLRHRPFAFYTATYTGSKNENFALSLGADRFILKPQEPDVLIDIIRELLDDGYQARQVGAKPLEEEMELFRQYNEVLFRKLEKKMQDQEITNQKLKLSEECYRQTFINASDVIYTIDNNLTLLDISPSVKRVLGYMAEDFVDRPVTEFGRLVLTPESFERALADVVIILGGRTITSTVYEFIAKDGTLKYGEVSGSPLMQGDKITGIVSVARDITDRKTVEEKLLESEEKFRSLFYQSIDAVLLTKPDGATLAANSEACNIFGYAEEEMCRMGREGVVDHSDPRLLPALEERHRTGRFKGELNFIRKDGTCFPGELSSVIFKNRHGEHMTCTIIRDITERMQAQEKLNETLERLRKALDITIQVMVNVVEARDPYTAGHQNRVADLACAIGDEMGLAGDKIDGLRMAGLTHDLGKLSVPSEILVKPTRLTEIEFSLVKEHSRSGYEILKDVESPWPLAEVAHQHHERIDGSGYPQNLKGEEILMDARIMAVADVVEAMASHRPYRPALGINAALEEIERNKGILYDDSVVDACLRLFREKGYQIQEV